MRWHSAEVIHTFYRGQKLFLTLLLGQISFTCPVPVEGASRSSSIRGAGCGWSLRHRAADASGTAVPKRRQGCDAGETEDGPSACPGDSSLERGELATAA